jgi:hypothetical protein
LSLKSTDAGVSWMPMALPGVSALAIDPTNPTTLYAGSPSCSEPGCVFKSTDEGGSWAPFNAGLPNTHVISLAVAPTAPTTIYAGTLDGGVYAIEQVMASCVGDCSGTSGVAINDLVTLVNVALGSEQPSACLHGVPSGAEVDVALLVQAVKNALLGCAVG